MPINIRDISVYALRKPPTVVNYRDVSVYALTKEQPQPAMTRVEAFALMQHAEPGFLTRLNAYVLLPDLEAADFSVTGKVRLRDIILKELGADVDGVKIEFVQADVLTNDPVYSSKVRVRALLGSKLRGFFDIRYNRYNLADALNERGLETLTIGNATSVHQLIAAINTKGSLTLTTDDLEDTPIPVGATGIELVSGPHSYYFKPGQRFKVGVDNSLENAIKISNLNGFDPA